MIDEADLLSNSSELFSDMETYKINPYDDKKIFTISTFAKIEITPEKLVFKYPTQDIRAEFKYIDYMSEDQFPIYEANLEKSLEKAIKTMDLNEIQEFLFSRKQFWGEKSLSQLFLCLHELRESIELDRNTVKIKTYEWEYLSQSIFKNLDSFDKTKEVSDFLKIAQKSHIVELKQYIKPALRRSDQELKTIYLFLFENEESIKDFYTYLSYSLLFSKIGLCNYFYNYIVCLVQDFFYPSYDHIMIFKNFNIVLEEEDINGNISYYPPFNKYCEKIIYEIESKRINRLLKGNNEKFENFVNNLNTFESEFSSENFNIEINDSEGNLKNMNLSKAMVDLKKELDNKLSGNNDNYEKFLFYEIKKAVEKYISFRGVFNIDIILSNERVNANSNSKFENFKKFICTLPKCLMVDCFNKIFKCNEGFFHKHIQIFDNCYSFNEKNIVHMFSNKEDSSQKNKIRVFDVLFRESWTSKIAAFITLLINLKSLLLTPVNDNFIVESYYDIIKKSIINFRKMVHSIYQEIYEEMFRSFPEFLNFSSILYKFPIKKFNHLDNVCHHFADYSLKSMLRTNFVKFSFEVINLMKEINEGKYEKDPYFPLFSNFPKLDKLYEECFIMYDSNLKNYLSQYFSLDKFLRKRFGKLDGFLYSLKKIDTELNRMSLYKLAPHEIEKKFKGIYQEIINPEYKHSFEKVLPIEMEKINETFPFSMYFNLYHFHKFEIYKKVYFYIYQDKNYENFDLIMELLLKLNELNFLVKTMTYKFFLYSNFIRAKLESKSTKYPCNIGHYLIQVTPEKSELNIKDYFLDYLNLRNDVMKNQILNE